MSILYKYLIVTDGFAGMAVPTPPPLIPVLLQSCIYFITQLVGLSTLCSISVEYITQVERGIRHLDVESEIVCIIIRGGESERGSGIFYH